MPVVDHDEFMVEHLREDPEFFRAFCEATMKEEDPSVFRESLQYIIKVKGFDLDVVAQKKEKEAA